ncbi:MAG: cytochrome c oxidase subunit II [Gammaproteobacteria bacterium]|nr:MAG: cytochrome c oxidase subunit II [Gammaproteobacteria bacterium]
MKTIKRLVLPTLLMSVPALHAEELSKLNLRPGVTEISHDVYDLHMMVLWICVAIGLVVFGAMFYSILKHRKSKGHEAAQFHESTRVEIIWTVIPFLIIVVMAFTATRTLVAMESRPDPDMTIKVTGYQWKWEYEYLDEGLHFFSNLATPRAAIENQAKKGEHYLLEVDKPVVVPVGKKIRFLFTANDVIHAWWMPDLAIKKDAIPGFINEAWTVIDKPGTYRGQCAELCGKDHGFMPIVLIAKNEADYRQWVQEQKASDAARAGLSARTFEMAELMQMGKGVYEKNCAACHQMNGEGVPGMFPSIKGSPVATGPLEEHIKVVLNGRPGTAMQSFARQLSDAEIAAVITYQRNAWGNDTGDAVQPAMIAARKAQ